MEGYSGTFQLKVVEFMKLAEITDQEEVEEMVTGIILYSLELIKYKDVKKIAGRLGIKPEFVDFKQKHLRNSLLVLGQLWRAMLYYVREKKAPSYKKFQVKKSDIMFCSSYLTKANIKALRKKAEGKYVERPKYKNLCNKILKELDPIIRFKVKRKLSFIFKYERALEEEDFYSELRTVAIKNIIKYSYHTDIEFVKRAIVQKLNHEIVDIIHRHTAQKRRYLIRTKKEKTKAMLTKVVDEFGNLKYQVSHPKISEASYSSKVVSLDTPIPNKEGERGATFHDFVSCTKNTFVNDNENRNFVNNLLKTLPSEKLKNYVRIIATTDWPYEFERFLRKIGVMNNELFSLKRLSDLAKRFLGLTQDELIKGIGPRLQKLCAVA